jgi:hydroxyacylglutathione hydrolase
MTNYDDSFDFPLQLKYPEFKGKPIIGGKDCENVTQTPKNGEGFKIGDITVTALYTPCHTKDSICWFMEDSTGKVIFTGDTLFHGGKFENRGLPLTISHLIT